MRMDGGCEGAQDVWLCIALKRNERSQKEWDIAHTAHQRNKEAHEMEEMASWLEKTSKQEGGAK